MTTTLKLASPRAVPVESNPDLTTLHSQAQSALLTALVYLREPNMTPETLQRATGRAIRAATLLKRAVVEGKGGKV